MPDFVSPCVHFWRFHVPGAGSAPRLDSEGGVLLLAARAALAVPCLVVDTNALQHAHTGCSATNAMTEVVTRALPLICQTLDCVAQQTLWVEWDSLGYFDQVMLHFGKGGRVEATSFCPLRSGTGEVRTHKEFQQLFPDVGAGMLAAAARLARPTSVCDGMVPLG